MSQGISPALIITNVFLAIIIGLNLWILLSNGRVTAELNGKKLQLYTPVFSDEIKIDGKTAKMEQKIEVSPILLQRQKHGESKKNLFFAVIAILALNFHLRRRTP